MSRKKILVSIGTRPNFIKITQFRRIAAKYADQIELRILHTGQHFDNKMSKVFFEQFDMQPDYIIDLDAREPAKQIGEIISKIAGICEEYQPDLLMTPGDVNSTLAAAITANKMNIPLVHIESGLRSLDREMPEEINRILTDEISDFLLITEQSGIDNLREAGVDESKLFHVGNTMIDTIVAFTEKIDASTVLDQHSLSGKDYVLMTMHRPSNVDHEEGLKKLIQTISIISERLKILFPIHPRTLKKANEFGLEEELRSYDQLILLEPLDYFSFQKLTKNAAFVVTDSGGIQEETTFYQIPCLTLRKNTERPSTIDVGTNELIEFEPAIVAEKMTEILEGRFKQGQVPELWDGKATERIFEMLVKRL